MLLSFFVRLLWKVLIVICLLFLFFLLIVIEIVDLYEIYMVIEELLMLFNFIERGFLMGLYIVGNFLV